MKTLSILTMAMFFGTVAGVQENENSDSVRTKAIQWIKKNNSFGPDARIVRDMTEAIDEHLRKKNDFVLSFGSNLMKSGKAHQIHAFEGEFFVFELSAERADKMNLKPENASHYGSKRNGQRGPSVANLSQFKIDNATELANNKNITGRVTLEALKPTSGKMVLRLSCRALGKSQSMFHYLEEVPKEKTTVAFSFDSLSKADDDRMRGPAVVFIDLCTVTEKAGQLDIRVQSNILAALVDVVNY